MKEKTVYICSECGARSAKWLGRCAQCGEWNTLTESLVNKGAEKKARIAETYSAPDRLKDIASGKDERFVTSINEFNRVAGGGIVRDSVSIITSPPGGGKSTLALAIANDIASQGRKAVYASGEESDSQIKSRADRILDNISENIWIIANASMDRTLAAVTEIDADLVIIDSIQTFSLEELLPSRAGSPTQTMECAAALVQAAKGGSRKRAVIMIGQMNKNDEIAGLRALEHLVDAVFIIDGDRENDMRTIVSSKNRFGSTGEMGFFSMTEKGLVSIDDPSEFFVTRRDEGETYSGSAVTVMREGSRAIICEVESLVSNSFTPYPSRIGEGVKKEQLNTVVSILEQRGKVDLFNKNVVVKATGGLRLNEPSVNLAMLMSIASSALNRAIPPDTAFIADVGLTGELKRVPSLEARARELDRMGFKRLITAKGSAKKAGFKNIEIFEFKTLSEVMVFIFKGVKAGRDGANSGAEYK